MFDRNILIMHLDPCRVIRLLNQMNNGVVHWFVRFGPLVYYKVCSHNDPKFILTNFSAKSVFVHVHVS